VFGLVIENKEKMSICFPTKKKKTTNARKIIYHLFLIRTSSFKTVKMKKKFIKLKKVNTSSLLLCLPVIIISIIVFLT
jgi:hypothetical protein